MSQIFSAYDNAAGKIFGTAEFASRTQWRVLKFDGRSVLRCPDSIGDIVGDCLNSHHPAILCSTSSDRTALQRAVGQLFKVAQIDNKLCKRSLENIVEKLRIEHILVAKRTLQMDKTFKKFLTEVNIECERFRKVLHAAPVCGHIAELTEGDVLRVEEQLSSLFIAALLNERNILTHFINWNHIIRSDVLEETKSEKLEKGLYAKLRKEIEMCGAKVPIIRIYVANASRSSHSCRNTDLLAALAAVGIEIRELQIWRETGGIYTADPCKVPTAMHLPTITLSEVVLLSTHGLDLIHPFTMEQICHSSIAIRVKSISKPYDSDTTIIRDDATALDRSSSLQGFTPLTAVIVKRNIVVVHVRRRYGFYTHDIQVEAFKVVKRWRFPVNIISSSNAYISFFLQSETGARDVKSVLRNDELGGLIHDLEKIGVVEIVPDMATLSLVGQRLTTMAGICGKLLVVLAQNNIRIEGILQVNGKTSISCIIEGREADHALAVAYTHLFVFV